MDHSPDAPTKTVDFIYKYFLYDGSVANIEWPISIPNNENINEMAFEMLSKDFDRKIAVCEKDLINELTQFIENETQIFFDNYDDFLINMANTDQIDINAVIRDTEKHFTSEVLEYADRIGPGDEEIFAQSFHRLVHSSLLPEILVKEKNYAKLISEMTAHMCTEINTLTFNQREEMNLKIEQLDVSTTSEDINNLLTKQYSLQNLINKKWQSDLDAKKGHQRNEYKNWITSKVGESLLSTTDDPTPVGNRSSMFVLQTPSMEESFTIHIGSQLKHMHNIRLLSADVHDLCSPLHTNEESLSGLNMAMGLYSCSLCGIVVLTPSGSVQANRKIIKNATISTELHFDQINEQVNEIQKKINTTKGFSSSPNKQQSPLNNNQRLKPGDFFITKHSNLLQTHVIFHLISDELCNSSDEINSRHPVILGLRNILKIASRHDITMLTIPAFLRHEMSEDMTVPWCVRRAELVFKCTKGFMIESASWSGAELSTLQLLLPNDISEELFGTLVSMIPHVFRVANPKFLADNSI